MLTPRWAPIGNDAYSKGPGHDALPDVKSLQILKKREHNAVDKHVNPPMGAHISLRGSASSVLPGAINYFTTQERGAGMWPLYQTAPGAIAEVVQKHCDLFNQSQDKYEAVCTGQGGYDKAEQNTIAAYRAKPAEAKLAISYGESKADEKLDASELAAWTLVTNLLLNLDETVTRE